MLAYLVKIIETFVFLERKFGEYFCKSRVKNAGGSSLFKETQLLCYFISFFLWGGGVIFSLIRCTLEEACLLADLLFQSIVSQPFDFVTTQ